MVIPCLVIRPIAHRLKMADSFVSGSSKLSCKVNNGRCLFKIVILGIAILSTDALSIKKNFKRDTNADSSSMDSTPPCNRNPMIGIPIDLQLSANKINVALTYNENDFPNRPFDLMLFEGDSTLDCSDVGCARHASPWRKVSGKSSVYDNLKSGYYCALLSYQDVCYYMSSTEHVNDTFSQPSATVVSDPPQKWIYVIMGISISVVVFLVFFVVWSCNRTKGPLPSYMSGRNVQSLHEAIKAKNPVPVFLLYNSDCKHHMSVIMQLAEFLEQNNCKVSCEFMDKHEMVINKISWMNDRLSGRFKILLVNSKMAFMKQKLWLKNYKNSKEIKPFSDDVFLHAITMISHRIHQMHDYRNLFMLLPSYVPKEYVLSDICPGKHYDFPRYLAVLLCHLHDVDPQSINFEEPSMSWDHCASAHDDLQRLVNSMTAYDDRGNLITGCKQCNAQVINTKPDSNLVHA